jgi:hypothetical protein
METIDLLRSGQLQGIKRLDLAAGLTEFPIEIVGTIIQFSSLRDTTRTEKFCF